MILSFLRAINHTLLADLARLQSDNAMLADRLERGDAERERVWDAFRESQRALETYHQMDKNVEWQSTGRPAPFPEVAHLPENMVRPIDNTPQPAHRSQGSEIVAKRTRDFRAETLRRHGVELVAE